MIGGGDAAAGGGEGKGVVRSSLRRFPDCHEAVRHLAARVKARVPRTRSSRDLAAGTVANFGFKSGTRIIELLVSFSIPKFVQRPLRAFANFGIETLAVF